MQNFIEHHQTSKLLRKVCGLTPSLLTKLAR